MNTQSLMVVLHMPFIYLFMINLESGESTTGFWINVSNLPGVPGRRV